MTSITGPVLITISYKKALHPYGTSFLTANTNGSVHDWDVPEDILNLSIAEAKSVEVEHVVEGVKVATASRLHVGSYVGAVLCASLHTSSNIANSSSNTPCPQIQYDMLVRRFCRNPEMGRFCCGILSLRRWDFTIY